MSDEANSTPPAKPEVKLETSKVDASKDSFDVPVKKSPLMMYALLQIPLVLFMVILLYVMYQSRQN